MQNLYRVYRALRRKTGWLGTECGDNMSTRGLFLSIKDAHDRQYNYMKITIFTLIRMIRLIGFNIQDIQIHVNIHVIRHDCLFKNKHELIR
jgi:hypothetical protein